MVMRWGPNMVQGPDGKWHTAEPTEARDRTETRGKRLAIAALVCGLVWGFGSLSLAALIYGYVALSRIRKEGGSGRRIAGAGIVLGWIGIVALITILVWQRWFFD